jgi:hypothetical protein
MVNSLPFRTADEAAVAALRDILPKSIKEQHEFGGYILQTGSGQQARFFSTPFPLQRSSEPRGGTLPPLKLPLQPPGAKLVAQIHTHPFDEDFYGEEGVISTIVKPPRFSPDKDVPERRAFESAWQRISPGPIDMYVIDIHNQVDVLEGKRGRLAERERMVKPCGDLTCI